MFRINLRELKMPNSREGNISEKIEWICEALGLTNNRDKDKTSVKIMELLLNSSKKNQAIRSEEISISLNIARSTALHHLEKYESSGIVIKRNGFALKGNSMEEIIDEIELDIQRALKRIKKVARDIDKSLGL